MAGPVDRFREWEWGHILPGTLGRASDSAQLCPATSPAPSIGMEQQPVFSMANEAYSNPSLYSLSSEGATMGVTTPGGPRAQGRDSNGARPPNVPHQPVQIVSMISQ